MENKKNRPWPRSYFSMNRLGDNEIVLFGGECSSGDKVVFF
jgi:hypothetical protein